MLAAKALAFTVGVRRFHDWRSDSVLDLLLHAMTQKGRPDVSAQEVRKTRRRCVP